MAGHEISAMFYDAAINKLMECLKILFNPLMERDVLIKKIDGRSRLWKAVGAEITLIQVTSDGA